MLQSLYIENIAVIEKAEIAFGRGFNVLTGETGAGKSMVIDAINAILGQRASKDLIRTGSDRAFVSACFADLSSQVEQSVEALGFSLEEDGTLLIQREISASGKGMCRVNGRPCAVSALRDLGALLIGIHGQHESMELLSSQTHMRYVDCMGDLHQMLAEYQDAYRAMRKIKEELNAVSMDEGEKARRMDLLQFQIDELEAAHLRPGELEELQQQKNQMLNSEKIASLIAQARTLLSGEDGYSTSALQEVQDAAEYLTAAVEYFAALGPLAQRVAALGLELEDCVDELRSETYHLEYNPRELEQIELRLDTLYRLSRKYGATEEEMLAYLDQCKTEWSGIQLSDERRQELQQDYEQAKDQVVHLAAALSNARSKAATQFCKQVKEELTFMDMPSVVFTVEQRRVSCNATGCDEMEFLISVNPGESPRPLSKIASGGELSRIMLAIKNVLSQYDVVDTMIFDEVDNGISGSAAQKVGVKLKQVAAQKQVICVTHLAQIAALGDVHFKIAKQVKDGRTFTEITPLTLNERKYELARIIGGVKVTDLTLKNAEEMLALAASVFQNAN